MFDEITSFSHLRKSAYRAAKGLRMTGERAVFFLNLEQEILTLQRELQQQRYHPRPFWDFRIRDPKPRNIRAAQFRDRVVHHSICAVLEPLMEERLHEYSFACRKGKGNHRAIVQAQREAKQHQYCGKIDILHCFETLNHRHLIEKLEAFLLDPKSLALIGCILKHGEEGVGYGLPIGNLTSQHFANYALSTLDDVLEERRNNTGQSWIRYMDDVLIFGDNKQEIWKTICDLDVILNGVMKQKLKDSTTMIFDVSKGIPFLGLRIFRNKKRLDKARVRRLRKNLRKQYQAIAKNPEMADLFLPSIQARLAWAKQADTKMLLVSFQQQLEEVFMF